MAEKGTLIPGQIPLRILGQVTLLIASLGAIAYVISVSEIMGLTIEEIAALVLACSVAIFIATLDIAVYVQEKTEKQRLEGGTNDGLLKPPVSLCSVALFIAAFGIAGISMRSHYADPI